jgi:hypothetical protein
VWIGLYSEHKKINRALANLENGGGAGPCTNVHIYISIYILGFNVFAVTKRSNLPLLVHKLLYQARYG